MLEPTSLRRLLENELAVDCARDDVTSRLLGSDGQVRARAVILAREPGVFSGVDVCRAFPGGEVEVECLVAEGATLEAGMPVVRLRGPVVDCLAIERTLLNFLGHLCGVATMTRRFVDAVAPHKTRILATRKTLPGLRELQLQAVRAGGGFIHRRSLSDGILVKENHLQFLKEDEVVTQAHAQRSPLHRVEVEVQSLKQLEAVLRNPPDIIMLDNFTLEQMRQAIALINGRCEIEVSGGMDLDRVAAIAALGVDSISVGRLTHSAPSLNLSLDFVPEGN